MIQQPVEHGRRRRRRRRRRSRERKTEINSLKRELCIHREREAVAAERIRKKTKTKEGPRRAPRSRGGGHRAAEEEGADQRLNGEVKAAAGKTVPVLQVEFFYRTADWSEPPREPLLSA